MRQRLWYSLTVSAVLWASFGGAQAADRGCATYGGAPDQTISACTALIQTVVDNFALSEFYESRGYAYTRKGEYDHAIADYDESAKRRPLDLGIYSFRGFAYDAKGDYDRAIQDFDEVIRRGKNTSAMDLNLRGNSYRHKGDYDRAIQDYDQALALVLMHVDDQPLQIQARFLNNRGLAKRTKGDVAGADADFAQARLLDPLTRCSTSPRNVLLENCFSTGTSR